MEGCIDDLRMGFDDSFDGRHVAPERRTNHRNAQGVLAFFDKINLIRQVGRIPWRLRWGKSCKRQNQQQSHRHRAAKEIFRHRIGLF